MQVYFYRNNAWTNAQSAGDQDDTDNPNPPSGHPVTPQPPAGGASGPAAAPVSASEALPAGVRLQLSFSTGQLTRDVLLSGQGY